MLILRHATKAQFLATLRTRYKEAEGPESLRLAAKMQAWIAGGDLTDAELRTHFGLTAAQVVQFKSRVQIAGTKYNDMLTVRGE